MNDERYPTPCIKFTDMRPTHSLLAALPALILCAHAHAQCAADNLVVNGDFNGTQGELVVAAGWTGELTPDLNDEVGMLLCTPGYVWVGTPLPSPAGGTWQNLYGPEAIYQDINTTVGVTYGVCLYYAAQGITGGPNNTYEDPTGVTVSINGVPAFNTPLDDTQYTWEHFCGNFLATTTTTTIRFQPSVALQYVGIDGVCVSQEAATGVGEHVRPALNFVPNPCTTGTRVIMPNGTDRVTATDASGRTVPVSYANEWLDLSQLAPGVYTILGWRNGEEATTPTRVVVEPR